MELPIVVITVDAAMSVNIDAIVQEISAVAETVQSFMDMFSSDRTERPVRDASNDLVEAVLQT